MKELQKELSAAFDILASMLVSGDNVERIAAAKEHLRTAYKLAEENNGREKN